MIGLLLRQEIDNTFHVVREKSTAEELVFLCPECNDKSGHRSVNLKSGKTFCWRCNKGRNNKGSFLAWARALGYQFLSSDQDYGSSSLETLFEPPPEVSAVPVIQEVALPSGFTPIARKPNGVYTRLITKMAQRKNLSYADFARAGVGYTMDDPRWEPYAIFPVYEYSLCAYYQGRTYEDVPGETTKRFPSRKAVNFGASYWVYNIDEVRENKPEIVVVVESILNVLSLRRKFEELGWNTLVPVCVFKHSVSQVQAIKLMRCKNIKELCFLFDHDAIDKTWRLVEGLSNKVSVTVAEMPMKNENTKLDANDDVDAAIDAIENRKRYTVGSASSYLLQQRPDPVVITGVKIRS